MLKIQCLFVLFYNETFFVIVVMVSLQFAYTSPGTLTHD